MGGLTGLILLLQRKHNHILNIIDALSYELPGLPWPLRNYTLEHNNDVELTLCRIEGALEWGNSGESGGSHACSAILRVRVKGRLLMERMCTQGGGGGGGGGGRTISPVYTGTVI